MGWEACDEKESKEVEKTHARYVKLDIKILNRNQSTYNVYTLYTREKKNRKFCHNIRIKCANKIEFCLIIIRLWLPVITKQHRTHGVRYNAKQRHIDKLSAGQRFKSGNGDEEDEEKKYEATTGHFVNRRREI